LRQKITKMAGQSLTSYDFGTTGLCGAFDTFVVELTGLACADLIKKNILISFLIFDFSYFDISTNQTSYLYSTISTVIFLYNRSQLVVQISL